MRTLAFALLLCACRTPPLDAPLEGGVTNDLGRTDFAGADFACGANRVESTGGKGVSCGQTCNAPGFCCVGTDSTGATTRNCAAICNAPALGYGCDGPEDCQNGVCCFRSSVQRASCDSACNNGQVLCHSSSDCSNGQICTAGTVDNLPLSTGVCSPCV